MKATGGYISIDRTEALKRNWKTIMKITKPPILDPKIIIKYEGFKKVCENILRLEGIAGPENKEGHSCFVRTPFEIKTLAAAAAMMRSALEIIRHNSCCNICESAACSACNAKEVLADVNRLFKALK